MISVEEANRRQYEKDEGIHNCGYWSVCDDHACGCAISNNVDGFDNGVYQSMKEDLQKQAEEFFEDDFDEWEDYDEIFTEFYGDDEDDDYR
jgi:hypothetical protein